MIGVNVVRIKRSLIKSRKKSRKLQYLSRRYPIGSLVEWIIWKGIFGGPQGPAWGLIIDYKIVDSGDCLMVEFNNSVYLVSPENIKSIHRPFQKLEV